MTSCRCRSAWCSHCGRGRPASTQPSGDWGIAVPFSLAVGFGWLVLCWPALAAHGQTDTGGWRWDIHSTYACAVWWGFLLPCALIGWVNHRTAKTATTKEKPAMPARDLTADRAAMQRLGRACRHPQVAPVELFTGERVAWLCLNPACGAQLKPGFRSAELSPDASWPPVRLHG